MAIEIGSKLTGKVTGITNFGAFVDLGEGQSGLVHISEISNEYVKNINDFLSVGDEVKVLVTNIDKSGKIALSMRKVEDPAPAKASKPARENKARRSKGAPNFKRQQSSRTSDFDTMMSNFLKDSDDRLASLKKNTEGKRGGRGGRRS
ncbi:MULTISPECIES: S1 domain-containing RNA-binding protein [Aerococcus]|uniref:RNA-binding protein S1 n=1 Tax=Aerococcus sanguinicola TaxID=119206 RepID=A0A5N1GV29_9LACT|nr:MULTISPECIES: S1 domain-containing RNA-binding protein [Aerococcus]KAA9302440.1 RNA-binding protein S1 [Aerococcus sanguinicola]MDK6369814.1 S1 domain-containing RNA-binding protein [Aerococcus sp. UMB9870]MDK6680454.1 S1 domain-containing RNA-binding protein [Aerococcus sp. UMB8608]MDK6687049.1 S1 domain-containing RNA-binding protein [Aerococcus sp. UMB8623]MDK6940268.1 S1 domain-containing RNA-binding protein [Aerococcus sp. UMB8487]